jgi:transglutaminase-like putative cysteine protease
MFFLLKFNSHQKGGKYLIFSLPESNQYQQIKDFKILFPKKYHIIKENRWGNKVIVFRLNDVLQKYPQISFNFQPKELKLKINKSFALNHYSLKQKLINNSFINGEDKKIKTLAKKIIGSEKNLYQIIKRLYNFTLDYLTYGKPTEGLYSYKQALTEKTTDCGGFSTFLASLIQSQNIPCRLVVGFIIKDNFLKRILNTFHVLRYTFHDLFMHAWLEVLLPDNSWLPLDPSIEWKRKKGLSKRQGGFGYIPADRLVVSFDCDFDIKIGEKNYKIDLLQKPKVI